MSDHLPAGPDGLLVLPQPIDTVRAEDAEPILEGAQDEVTVLRLELAEVGEEVEAARRAAAQHGFEPEVISAARRRIDELVRAISDEADLHAAAVTAEASTAAAAIVDRAERHAHLLRTGEVLAAPPPQGPPLRISAPPRVPAFAPVAEPVAQPAAPPAAGTATAPAQAEQLLQQLLAAVVPVEEEDSAPTRGVQPYASTLGLLQVVTWSILVAVVLVVLLAWFA